jgi:putative NADPH-quinone reductase
MLRQLVFGYVGFNPIRFTTFGAVRTSSEAQRFKWLKKVEIFGQRIK